MKKLTLLAVGLMFAGVTFAHDCTGNKNCCKGKKECKKEAKADCKGKACCKKSAGETAKK